MPVHDWTRVSDGTFHDFHYSWVLEIKRALKPLLPKGYYVMAEQLSGDLGATDVLTLQTAESAKGETDLPLSGTATLTESPPAVHARATIARDPYARLQRSVVIRHTSDDRIVAMIEVRPLTAVAYRGGGAAIDAFVVHFAVGQPIPEMPLFLTAENYVRVPLEATYQSAFEDVPTQYQQTLLAR